jgi:hypothetical protein
MIRRAFPLLLLCSCADLIGITDAQDFDVVELSVSVGTLSPAFDPAIDRYELALGYPDTTLEIHAAASDPEVVFDIAGETAVEGTGIKLVELGDSTVDVVARTPTGVTKTYQIAVHRADLIISFAAPRQVPTQLPGMVDRVALVDFDGDDSLDLAPMTGTGEVGVLLNDRSAHFAARGQLPYGGVRQIASRDLDNDGKLDLMLMNGGFQILRGLGNANFDAGFGCGAPPSPTAFTMFQFDADGIPDLAMVDQTGRLAPMRGMPPPTSCFQNMPASEQQVSPTALTAVVAGPFDASAGDDLASLDPSTGRIFVHRNINGGGLSIEQLDLGGVGPRAAELAAADLDGDGRAELIWIDRTTDDVVVQKFPGPRGASFHVLGNPRSLVLADVDGDALLDIVVQDNMGLTVLHNEAGGTFSAKTVPMQLPGVTRIALADLDGDGRADLVTANFTSTVSVYLGDTP